MEPGSELYGKAFENWCFHELRAYNIYNDLFAELTYWRLAGGTEVDFIINTMETAIEVKASSKILPRHLKGLRALKEDHPYIKRRMVVCLENKARITNDKIEIIYKTEITEIKGESSVKSVIFDNGTVFEVDGVFIEIGSIPNSNLARRIGVNTNEKGEIIINRKSETNIPGIYAAGDVADAPFKQAITGVAEGVIAAYSSFDYLKEIDIEY